MAKVGKTCCLVVSERNARTRRYPLALPYGVLDPFFQMTELLRFLLAHSRLVYLCDVTRVALLFLIEQQFELRLSLFHLLTRSLLLQVTLIELAPIVRHSRLRSCWGVEHPSRAVLTSHSLYKSIVLLGMLNYFIQVKRRMLHFYFIDHLLSLQPYFLLFLGKLVLQFLVERLLTPRVNAFYEFNVVPLKIFSGLLFEQFCLFQPLLRKL